MTMYLSLHQAGFKAFRKRFWEVTAEGNDRIDNRQVESGSKRRPDSKKHLDVTQQKTRGYEIQESITHTA